MSGAGGPDRTRDTIAQAPPRAPSDGPAPDAYRLRWTLRDRDGARERTETVRAAGDPEAIEIARAAAEAADEALLAVALHAPDGRRIWGLERGETLSRRPDDAPRP